MSVWLQSHHDLTHDMERLIARPSLQVQQAAMVLVREKNGKYQPVRVSRSLCIVSTVTIKD